jgi:hypothetical protein
VFAWPAARRVPLQKQPMLFHQSIDALGVDRFLLLAIKSGGCKFLNLFT